jgi:hypothetical protein
MDHRFATKDDAELILEFIHNLAKYEKMENEVIATKELLYIVKKILTRNTACDILLITKYL